MKKKILLSVILVVLMTFGISTVYANMVDYTISEKICKNIDAFSEKVGSPLIEILALMTISFFSLGIIILSIYLTKDEEYNRNNAKNYLPILTKFYIGLVLVLNILQTIVINIALSFFDTIYSTKIIDVSLMICIIYVGIIIIISIFLSIKKKKMKAIYIFITIITIFLFIACANLALNFLYNINYGRMIGVFFEEIGLPLTGFLAILTISIFSLGIIILSIYLTKDEKYNRNNAKNYLPILTKFYIGLVLVLNFIQVQIINLARIFVTGFIVGSKEHIDLLTINKVNLIIYIIYALITIFLSIRKKHMKEVYIIITIVTTLLFAVCAYMLLSY